MPEPKEATVHFNNAKAHLADSGAYPIEKAQVEALLALVATLQEAMDRAPGIFRGARRQR